MQALAHPTAIMGYMSDVPPPERKRTREAAALGILTALSVVASLLLALVIWPFWKALFLASVLAAAIYPAYQRLAARLTGRRQLAALLLTLTVTLVLVVPTILLTISLSRQAVQAFAYIHETLHSEGLAGLGGGVSEPPAPPG